ncbi:MAG: hypothetical protein D6795_15135, partial [Deltaproteobacteria bacterium]
LLILSMAPAAWAVDFEVDLHGYYRLRMDYFSGLKYTRFTFDPSVNRFSGEVTQSGEPAYMDQRFRLDPTFRINERVSLYTQFDILGDTLFGNNGEDDFTFLSFESPTSSHGKNLFGEPNGEIPQIEATRVYGEARLSVGMLRFGRMPLSWGMGLLFHPGDGLDDNDGTTVDQIYYLTRPTSLWGNYATPFYIGGGYGNHREGDIFVGSDDVKEWFVQIFHTNEDLHEQAQRPFWQRRNEENWIGLYFVNRWQNNESRSWQQQTNEGRSYAIDFYFRRHLGPLFVSSEVFLWLGEADFVLDHPLFPGKKILFDEVDFRQYNGALRAGWQSRTSDLFLEYGYASPVSDTEFPPSLQEILSAQPITNQGDPNEGNFIIAEPIYEKKHLNGGRFDRNYNVDLIVFEELLDLYTQLTPTPTDDTNGGVYNAQYLRLFAQRKFYDKRLTLKGAMIFSWLNANHGFFWGARDRNGDGRIDLPTYQDVITTDCSTEPNSEDCVNVVGPDGTPTQVKKVRFEIAQDENGLPELGDFVPVGNILGFEIDTDLAYHIRDGFTFGIETGLAIPGGFFDNLVAVTDPFDGEGVTFSKKILFTIQARFV